MKTSAVGTIVAVAALMLFGACSDGATVTMNGDHRFAPQQITVEGGETIVFENTGAEVHTVTADQDGIPAGARYFASGGFSSERGARNDIAGGLVAGGDRFEIALDTPGTYRYVCLTHEQDGMRGTIVVGD
jgi:plastocyanin